MLRNLVVELRIFLCGTFEHARAEVLVPIPGEKCRLANRNVHKNRPFLNRELHSSHRSFWM